MAQQEPRLMRDTESGMLGGVCAGIARRWNYDVTLIRVVWVLLTVLSAGIGGVVLYVAAWLIIPAGSDGEAAPRSREQRMRDVRDDLTVAGDRASASAKVIARATREAAQEIGGILRGRPAPGSDTEKVVDETERRMEPGAEWVGKRTRTEADEVIEQAPGRAREAVDAAQRAAEQAGETAGTPPPPRGSREAEATRPAQPAEQQESADPGQVGEPPHR